MAILLVTGGAGFIGANFGRYWTRANETGFRTSMLKDSLFKNLQPEWNISTICGEPGVLLLNIGQPHEYLSVSNVIHFNKKRDQQK